MPKIIARTYFNNEQDRYEAICQQIADDLRKKTTLLILDALDEAEELGEKFSMEALDLGCKILFISRSCDLRSFRDRHDVVMECIGLNDEQLEKHLRQRLDQSKYRRMAENLKSNSSLWTMAHVPVNTNILCALLNEEHDENASNELFGSCEHSLYQDLSLCLWKR